MISNLEIYPLFFQECSNLVKRLTTCNDRNALSQGLLNSFE